MTTLNALRARLRTRLEEATPAVWTDTELDECLTGALEQYSDRYPAEIESVVAVALRMSPMAFCRSV